MGKCAVNCVLENQELYGRIILRWMLETYFMDGRGMELAVIVSKNVYYISGFGQYFGTFIND